MPAIDTAENFVKEDGTKKAEGEMLMQGDLALVQKEAVIEMQEAKAVLQSAMQEAKAVLQAAKATLRELEEKSESMKKDLMKYEWIV